MGSTDFNGTTDVGTVTHHTDLNMTDWTLAGWIKRTGAGEGDFRIFSKASAANAGALQLTGQSGFDTGLRGRQIRATTASIAISHSTDNALPLDTWVCVFAVFNSADGTQGMRLYKYDGVSSVTEMIYSSVTAGSGATSFNTNDLYVGNTSDGSLALDGKMAYWALDASVWNNATMLSFAQGTVPAGTDCFWPMQGDGSNSGTMTARTIAFTGTTFDSGDSPPVSYGGVDDVFIVDRPTGLWLNGPRTVQVVQNLQLVDFPTGMGLGGPATHLVTPNAPGAPSDNFNRPNQVGLGGSWAEHSGSWAISSNTAISTAAPGVASLANVADVETRVDVIVPSTGDVVAGCANRVFDDTSLVGAEIVRTGSQQKVIAFRRISGVDRELGSTGLPITTGTHQLMLRTVGRDVLVALDGDDVLHCRLSPGEHAALSGTRTGLIAFSFPAGTAWDNFVTDDTPDPIVVPQLRATFNHTDVPWLESGGSTNGWHEWNSSSPAWQVVGNEAAQLTTGYAPVTVPTGGTEPLGVTVTALGQEFWLLFRARDNENYYRFGRAGSGNYEVQKIENNGLGTIDGFANPGGAITPVGGDRLVVEETGSGFECYVVRGGTPTLFVTATDVEWAEYADQAGLAAFNSSGLRFDDMTMEGGAGTLDAVLPLQVVDLAGEVTSVSSELDVDIPLMAVALVGGVEDTVAGTLSATVPLTVVTLAGTGPNSMTLDVGLPLLVVEFSSLSEVPDSGDVDVRPPVSMFDTVFPVRWPPWRWKQRVIR